MIFSQDDFIRDIIIFTFDPNDCHFVDIPKKNDYMFKEAILFIEQLKKENKRGAIFDRYKQLNETEVTYLIDSGFSVFEPSIITRHNKIKYLPAPVKVGSWKNKKFDIEKEISCAIHSEIDLIDKQISVDKYYNGEPLIKDDLEDVRTTVLIGSREDYQTGTLNIDLNMLIDNAVIPLIPVEHRFLCGLFNESIIRDSKDINFYSKTYKCNFGFYNNLTNNIKSWFSEMTPEYFLEQIKNATNK